MRYHDILKFDMLNGEGIRVVLFVSGCNHHCKGCQNPETWDPGSGILFDESALNEIIKDLKPDYISGLTLSGGDPLFYQNLDDVLNLVKKVKEIYPNKTIWLYSGYTYNELFPMIDDRNGSIAEFVMNGDDSHVAYKEPSPNLLKRQEILKYCDVLVDGKFVQEKLDANYPWAGSTNQKVIYLKEKRA